MEESDFVPRPYEDAFTDVATAEMKPPTWVIKDLLPVGLTFIAAPPKAQKSTVTMAMAALTAGYECATLPPFLSEVVNGGPTLAFSYEATAGELRYMLEHEMGVRLEANAGILIADDPFGFRLDDPGGLRKLLGWLDGRMPRICILDPLRDFHSGEEKDSGYMNRLMRPLRQWAVDNEAALIVVHHTAKLNEERKYQASDMRGSGALFGIADAVLMFTPVGERQDVTVNIQAIFKRATAWECVVQLKAYNHQDRQASELLTGQDLAILTDLRKGRTAASDIALAHRISERAVIDSMKKLQRNGHLDVLNGVKYE